MGRFAEHTKVPIDQSRNEIERTLTRYGADKFAYVSSVDRAVLMFEAHRRRIRFDMPLPTAKVIKDDKKLQQERRRLWRALLLCIKSKLESVESGIETFEDAFLAHIVLPTGQTVGEYSMPKIAQAYDAGTMVPLLPGPQ